MDSLPARFLKDGAEVIACPWSHIMNLSLHSSQIPEDMKNARVVPLYKNTSKTEPGKYRTVSILSVTSKILERVVYNQLEHYLKEKKLLQNCNQVLDHLFLLVLVLLFLWIIYVQKRIMEIISAW